MIHKQTRIDLFLAGLIGLALPMLLGACSSPAPQTIRQSIQQFVDRLQPATTPSHETAVSASQAETSGNTLPVNSTSEGNEQFLIVEEIVIAMLFLAVLVGIVANRLRVPYTVGLVLIGLALTLGVKIDMEVSPNLILALLVPPLLFEAAFHLNLSNLKDNLAHILTLAVPGVILTTVLVGLIVSWGTGLALSIALVFGALVSATDPVSVIALFRTWGVPKRLQVLLEGESLFNDGTAIVIFDLVVVLAIHGFESFNWITSLVNFVWVAGGGLVVGLILGSLISQMISRIDDYLIETTLTSILAFGSYLIAEMLGVSGVLAVVAAGLINGNIGPRGMSPTTRIVVYNFWEYAGFLANSFIFLLIGLQIDLTILFENMNLILWAIIAILAARAVGVYLLPRLAGGIPFRWQHVLYWGGLRGAISLALALSLPATLGIATNQVRVMAFGVVLFTLIVQGFTMGPLVRKLHIIERSESQDEYERRHARALASRTAYEHLHKQYRQGLLSEHSWSIMAPLLEEHNKSLTIAVKDVLANEPDLEAEEMDTAHREYLRAQRSTINTLLKDGIISNHTFEQLTSEIDAALTRTQASWQELFGQTSSRQIKVNRMMVAMIQEQDVESAISTLTKIGIAVTCLPSTGGFLGRRNTTLLIGLEKGQEEAVVKALDNSCRKRVEYQVTPSIFNNMIPMTPIEVEVGGATIFTFEVERFEIFFNE
jgi:CPA1 family monovalent cation:H+ antiporter